MNEVWYFSAAGHSRKVALFFAKALKVPLKEIDPGAQPGGDAAVVVFPVYCQNIPEPVKAFLPRLQAGRVVLVATYGRMGYGNVLWEGARLLTGQVIGAAFVPSGHTYRKEEVPIDFDALRPHLSCMEKTKPVSIPKLKKWWLGDCFPKLRGKLSVRLRKNERCTGCGLCSVRCPMGTMQDGTPGNNCIRCLRCVYECPEKALTFVCHPVLRWYLHKPRQTGTVLYL